MIARPHPDDIASVLAANRPHLMAVVEAIKIIIPAPRKDAK